MTAAERRTQFQELLLSGFHEIQAEIIGWVILPNHYHMLVNVGSLNLISDTLKRIHGFTSHEWNLQDGLTGERKVWLRFSDRLMRSVEQLNIALNYIHYNPIKHGLVEDVYNWSWSSLMMYESENGQGWFSEYWGKYTPPADFGKDWDS